MISGRDAGGPVPPTLKILIAAIPVAFVIHFLLQRLGAVDFWWSMGGLIVVFVLSAAIFDKEYLPAVRKDLTGGVMRKIALGTGSALFLYGVFFMGNIVSPLIFPFAGSDIGNVYLFKGDAAEIRIVILLALVIGPGEELLWRGFFQRRLSMALGRTRGLITATLVYAAVHAATGNIMLVLAALTCGLFWGFIYRRTGSLLLVCVSHTLWDVLAFIIFPFA